MSSVRTARLAILISLALFACVITGCGQGGDTSSGAGPNGRNSYFHDFHDPSTGITAVIPTGWHPVPPIDLAGGDIALQLASFRPRGGVRTICDPHNIVDQIPSGGALVQLLEDTAEPASSKNFPALQRPFRLGPLEGHECGEAYNIFFGEAGRGFQLRVWTTPTGPSRTVRHQIQELVDSLKVQSQAEAVRAAVRASRLPRASAESPFIALDCPVGNDFACDRLYFYFALSVRTKRLQATVAGRPVRGMRSYRLAPGATSGSARTGYSWEGFVHPAGFTQPGAPLFIRVPRDGHVYWSGKPPVHADVRVRASFPGGGSVTQIYHRVPLGAGHG